MLKRMIFTLIFFVSACVTVNIYFPAAAVERAADQIVKETWGGPAKPATPVPQPQSRSLFSRNRFASAELRERSFCPGRGYQRDQPGDSRLERIDQEP